jgi:CheY-like chemotaxis protein
MDRKILIVDDEADIREILQFNLENAGFNVECASSAEEALEKLSPEHGLILLDVMMGGMSGFAMQRSSEMRGTAVFRSFSLQQRVPRMIFLPDSRPEVMIIFQSRSRYRR